MLSRGSADGEFRSMIVPGSQIVDKRATLVRSVRVAVRHRRADASGMSRARDNLPRFDCGRRTAGRGRCAALFALFALLFQASIALWHQPPAASGRAAERNIHVMLGHVAPAPAAAHEDEPHHDHPDQDRDRQPVPPCPICQTLQHAGAFFPASAFTLFVPWRLAGRFVAGPATAGEEANQVPYGARAPPFAA
jgi:hypothetical protein